MRIHHFLLLLALLMLASCGPKKPTVAERKAEKRMQDSIALLQQERSLHYYDSLNQSLIPVIDSLLPLFRYEKQEAYEDKGRYLHRQLSSTKNDRRNYLQAYVLDDGTAVVRCFYFGEKKLNFEHIQLRCDSLENTFTGKAHAFEAEGWHELLTIEGDNALELLHFVDIANGERLRISYLGNGHSAVFYLAERDRQALMTTYHLMMALRDNRQLEMAIRKTSLEIQKYQKRLQKVQ